MKFAYFSRKNIYAIPQAAGVYSFWNKKELLYIGKAANLKERVKTHFQQPSYRDHLFIGKVSRIGYITAQSEIDALLLESQLIKKYQPKYNVMWKDDKNYFYAGIAQKPIPYVFLTHQIRNPKSNFKYIGPFVEGKAIKEVLRNLRGIFPYYTSPKHPAKKCPWCHLHLCPGPFLNKEEYKKNMRNLAAVLEGRRLSVLKNLKKEMEQASREQNFERAAKLRDQFFNLEKIISHSQDAQKILQKIFRVKKEIARIEAYDISNMQGKEATGSMVTFLNGEPAKTWYRKFKMRVSGTPNDFAMIEQVISRRLNHPEWPYPDLMIIDGGKGQLTSALRALRKFEAQNPKHETNSKLKIQNSKIFVVAIAKRHNELFLPNRKTPILLKNLPQPVQNLILHIRDEAHRFAITYHKKLRKVDFFNAR